MQTNDVVMQINQLNLAYGAFEVLRDITLGIKSHRVTAIIGPSGSGKSSLIRCLNRMVDLVPSSRISGEIYFENNDILSSQCDVVQLRQRVGMVFQKPNPFPRSIYDNIAYGPRLRGVRRPEELDHIVESALRDAALWQEVHDRLNTSALDLSGGQQQRLCIARCQAVKPRVLLMDEPCSALDPASTASVEDLITGLRENVSIVLVTHNLQQAARISDYTVFLLDGQLVEHGPTQELFTRAEDQRTDDYVTGRFG